MQEVGEASSTLRRVVEAPTGDSAGKRCGISGGPVSEDGRFGRFSMPCSRKENHEGPHMCFKGLGEERQWYAWD